MAQFQMVGAVAANVAADVAAAAFTSDARPAAMGTSTSALHVCLLDYSVAAF